MGKIAVTFTYHTDIVSVPSFIENNLSKYQMLFDKWLYDKTNNHSYWIVIDGKKRAVSFDTEAFVEYLNNMHLQNQQEKAVIFEKNTNSIPANIPTIFF